MRIKAQAQMQTFFASPLPDKTPAGPDRAPASSRLSCLRCGGSVEGPKYSTCRCLVPALRIDDLKKDEPPVSLAAPEAGAGAGAGGGGGVFQGMLQGMRRSSAVMAQSINEAAASAAHSLASASASASALGHHGPVPVLVLQGAAAEEGEKEGEGGDKVAI